MLLWDCTSMVKKNKMMENTFEEDGKFHQRIVMEEHIYLSLVNRHVRNSTTLKPILAQAEAWWW